LLISRPLVGKILQSFSNLEEKQGTYKALHHMESSIITEECIKETNVYITVDRTLKTSVVQRSPIGRIFNAVSFYIDETGREIPLSSSHTVRVPIVYGYTKEYKLPLIDLLKFINSDEFLRSYIVGITCNASGIFDLEPRTGNYRIHFGDMTSKSLKFSNFKAFYAKASKDNSLKNYKSVNLAIDNQVICTRI